MDQKSLQDFEFNINPEDPVFVISVVSKIVRIPIWTLRKLDDMGVVCPKRIGTKTRCYSKAQVVRLNYVYHLMNEEGINISGIRFILEKQEGGDEGNKKI